MKLNYFSAVKFLSRYIFKHKKNFIMFYIGWFFDMVLSVSMPVLFGIMVDEIVYYRNLNAFLRISLVFVVMTLFSCILYFFIYAQHHYLMNMYTYDIKKDVFDHLQKCDPQTLTELGSGDIVQILQHYTNECMHFIIRNLIHFLNSGVIRTIVITAYLIIINPLIGAFVIAAAPVSVFISVKFGKKIRSYSDKQRDYYGRYVSWAYEMLSALSCIRMLGATKKASKEFIKQHREMFNINVKSGVSSLTSNNIVGFCNLVIQLCIFSFAGYLSKNAGITMGTLTVVVAFYSLLSNIIKWQSQSFLDAQNRISYIQRIYDFLSTPTEDNWPGKNELIVTNGKICFKDISFSYANSYSVLNGLSLNVEAGTRIALIGESGSGKTTLTYILIGFYRPLTGYIEIDGQKLNNCTLKSIRNQIGIIQQDVLLFDGTIRENLLFGSKNASEDEIKNACKRAGIWEYIEGLPNGLDTVVGKTGIGLSGGQKQRIAISRVYLKNPKIIIFDEATSSLDSETEEQIHKAWESVLYGRTCIVVAHRESSVLLCEKTAVLENGTISEIGNTRHLKENSHTYKKLFAYPEK